MHQRPRGVVIPTPIRTSSLASLRSPSKSRVSLQAPPTPMPNDTSKQLAIDQGPHPLSHPTPPPNLNHLVTNAGSLAANQIMTSLEEAWGSLPNKTSFHQLLPACLEARQQHFQHSTHCQIIFAQDASAPRTASITSLLRVSVPPGS